MIVWPGSPYPLGATWDGAGVNFSLFSENAEKVELCFYGSEGSETGRVSLSEYTDHAWHAYLPDVRPGQRYAYRVYGPYEPQAGHRFNPAKLLIDPYAKAIAGAIEWDDSVFGYRIGDSNEDLSHDERDSGAFVPKGVVVDRSFCWGGDRPPNTPLNKSVIYELHVEGFSKLHPAIPPELRGTYAALSTEAAIDYLLSLGITAVELMPVHHFVNDRVLVDRGLSNYWGYNTIGFFAPHSGYSSTGVGGEQVAEFKTMVRTLHREGIEVILDVVYNHTAEGNHLGPTLSFRGIDNLSYYRLVEDQMRYYMDYSGTGNSPNMRHPRVLQLIMDSLRYWVEEMHVDGFRFDLASTLAREFYEVDRLSTFFDVVHQDPVLSQVKLIAEPWDLGPGGYQVGNFPLLWAEWNGRYRDTIRRFWRGDPGQAGDLAYRLSGSSDLYESSGKRPSASVNFITAHDGFTLEDLVSYEQKHNEANQEGNRDGSDENYSWNCGVEGPSDDPSVRELRERQKRNLIGTLLVSQGVPMILGGDERGRTQGGNNNAYCQNTELAWTHWELGDGADFLRFVRYMLSLRPRHPMLTRRNFLHGKRLLAPGPKDVTWLCHNGREMEAEHWNDPNTRSFAMLLAGSASDEIDNKGRQVQNDAILVAFNAHFEPLSFVFPGVIRKQRWEVVMDTRFARGHPPRRARPRKMRRYDAGGRSMALLLSRDSH